MLPPVFREGEAFLFKFWFNGCVQDGMSYQQEMFYRHSTVEASQRSRLYHYACKLVKRNSVIVTLTDTHCSLWISLRSPVAEDLAPKPQAHECLQG